MSDETQQTTPEPSQPEPTPTQPEAISEPVSQPTAPSEPVEPAPTSPTEPIPPEVPPELAETPPSPEGDVPVNNDISANEPFDEAPDSAKAMPDKQGKPSNPAPEPLENPNITVEKHGTDTTITEVMNQPETPTAQMAGSEPLDLAEELKTKQRAENLKLANQTRQEKKRKKIDAILDLFAKQTNLTNDEVEKLLHVSDATATRYLDELEKEGKIKQVGATGQGVKYERI